MVDLQSNVETLNRLDTSLEDAREELAQINIEQQMFEWEMTEFPLLQETYLAKEPYDKLWKTAYDLHTKNEEWLSGPFNALNAEAVDNEVSEMWRTMYKLTKTFQDQPGPLMVANKVFFTILWFLLRVKI